MENARRNTHTEALYQVISAITDFFFFSFYLEHHTSKLSLFSLESLAFLRGYM